MEHRPGVLRRRPGASWPFAATLLSFVAFGAGCRPARPAAAPFDVVPSVRVTPERTPAGGPVSLQCEWKTGPTFGRIRGPYRAFVHFVDREGSLLFTDDHRPSPDASQWLPDRTYAYRRTVLTREFPYAGEVTVLMGLYAEGASGERLPLRGVEQARRAYRCGRLTLAPRDRDLELRWDGLYEAEASALAPLFLTRFMKRSASCRFDNPKQDVLLVMSADVARDAFREPPSLTVEGRGDWRRTLPLALSDDAQLLRVRVPAAALGRHPEATLRFDMSASYVPKALGASGDTRELSLRILGAKVLRVAQLDPALLESAGEGL